MKKQILIIINIFLILSLACTFSSLPWDVTGEGDENQAILLFTIGVHIEPFGSQVSQIVGGEAPIAKRNNEPDYHNLHFYNNHVQNLYDLADMVESHGGHLTIQVQTPFTTITDKNDNTVLMDLAEQGHEMALHFHENAHLGVHSSELNPDIWCAVMKEEISLISSASGVKMDNIRYWSGGNLYPHLLEAADCAGLDVNSDWKNPETQTTDLDLVGVNPWRPAGSSIGSDVNLFAQHDGSGNIIFLPEGEYDRENYIGKKQLIETEGEEAYFDFLEDGLMNSLAAASADKVNVYHFTVHGGELVGDVNDPYAFLNSWLTEVIDPLVADGSLQWATFSEMADAFIDWEAQHADEDARAKSVDFDVCLLRKDDGIL